MASTPNYQASGAGVNATNLPLLVAWPAHATDDYALLLVQTSNETVTLSDPQGFAEITETTLGVGTGAGSVRLTMFSNRATSNAMGSPTIAAVTDHLTARIGTVRNAVKTGTPWWGSEITVNSAVSSASVTIPGLTNPTTYDNTLILQIVANGADTSASITGSQANADLASVVERMDFNQNAGNGGGFCITSGTKDAKGTVGPMTATLAVGAAQIGVTLAFKPIGADQAQTGWMQPMGSSVPRSLTPRVRDDLWVEPGDVRAQNPDLDTWENI